MKKFYFFALLSLLYACHQQTLEEKLTEAELKICKKGHYINGEQMDSVKIDKMEYTLCTLKDYYKSLSEKASSKATALENNSENQRPGVLSDAFKQTKDSIEYFKNEEAFIDNLAQNADTAKNLYFLKYMLSFKINNSNNISVPARGYVYQKDLSYVYINIDSIYRAQLKK